MTEYPCINFEQCGNIIPEGLSMCTHCLDTARKRQREFFSKNPRATVPDYGKWLEDHGYVI